MTPGQPDPGEAVLLRALVEYRERRARREHDWRIVVEIADRSGDVTGGVRLQSARGELRYSPQPAQEKP